MKTIIQINILIFSLLAFSCKAQTTVSLLQMEECSNRPNRASEGCPDLQGAQYVKDIGNRLDPFVGIWKGTYDGKHFELRLEKKINFGENEVKWDKLIGRMLVKDNNGNIIYNSLGAPDNNTKLRGDNFQGTTYVMDFTGNYDCKEYGGVFITILPLLSLNNPNQEIKMQLFYFPDTPEISTTITCPNPNTFVPLLPKEWMTLIKQ